MSYVFILLFLPPTFLFFCFCSQLNSHTLHSRSCLSIILSLLCSTALLCLLCLFISLLPWQYCTLGLGCWSTFVHLSFRPLSHIALYKINIFPSMSSFFFFSRNASSFPFVLFCYCFTFFVF